MEKIMDRIGKKAVDTYNYACKGVGEFTKEVKLKSKMAENKKKIQELYEDIGKRIYENYVLNQDINIDKDLLNTCSTIDIVADEIEDTRMELLKLKKLKQCPNCHYEIYYEFNFCPNCGRVQKQENEKENESSAIILTTNYEDSSLKKHTYYNNENSEKILGSKQSINIDMDDE